jgi:UDP-N-acetylmuramoyl-tripeptide--D-alanyl-D-alanine ligase
MIAWDFYQHHLASVLTGPLPTSGEAPQPNAFKTDTRTIQAGEWFIPLRGPNFDGHQFLLEAQRKGAVGALVQSDVPLPPGLCLTILPVTDTLRAYQAIAKGWRLHLHPTVISITGSLGKTTTKELTRCLFEKNNRSVLATEGNFNNEIGVPHTMLRLEPHHQVALLELGARHPGDIQTLTEMAQPDIAVLISIESVHLEIFGSIQALAQTKMEIFTHSPPQTLWVANLDNPWIARGVAPFLSSRSVISYGQSPACTVQVISVETLPEGRADITLRIASQGSITLDLPSSHPGYVQNTAAACAIGYAAGLSLGEIKQGLSTFPNVRGRFFRIDLPTCTLIDDTYNAHPSSMKAGLGSLEALFPTTEKTIVLGDMLELGEDWQTAHREIGGICAQIQHLQHLLTVGERGFFIAEGARKAGLSPSKIEHYTSTADLLQTFPLPPKGVLYAKASRAIGLDRLISHIITPSV